MGILRHILMEKCKFNPAPQRLQYAFMLFKAATIQRNERKRSPLTKQTAGSMQFHALLAENMTGNASMLNSSQPPGTANLTQISDEVQKNQKHDEIIDEQEVESPLRDV